jgi:D-alanyl-lipoteichoic acid acyltransferase DltB (MBOAT superfamily)
MLFPTVQFAVFFVVVFTLNWLLRPYFTVWRIFLIGASWLFYAAFRFTLLPLLIVSSVGNWLAGHAIVAALGPSGEKTSASKWVVRVAVGANLAVLVYFKYLLLIERTVLNSWLNLDMSTTFVENIILPIGISFFTFHAISYVVDLGRGTIRRPMSLLDFLLYMAFFPHLVAGPIVRAAEFAPQIAWKLDPRRINAAPAFRLIAAGLFKKVVISTFVADQIVDPVFRAPTQHSAWEVLWGILGYAVQIYADFSGYTDIAIGCALLLGFRFPQNFDAPYIARSVQDFWRRWHMTLSRWLRDYLYIPLGGNRKGVTRTYFNLMMTMLLGGLWHGADWKFVVWGSIHGGALAVERAVNDRWRPSQEVLIGCVVGLLALGVAITGSALSGVMFVAIVVGCAAALYGLLAGLRAAEGAGLPSGLLSALHWLLTFTIVCIAWVFFRAPTVDLAFDTLGQLVSGWGPPPHPGPSLVHPMVIFVIVGMLASQFVPPGLVMRGQEAFSRISPVWQALALGGALLVIDTLGPAGIAPFIYFQF